jgi:hypothetical protein
MIPAPAKALWLLWGVFALLLVLTVGLAYLAWSTGNVRFEVSPAGLRISGDLFGRLVPGASLLADQAHAVDLARSSEYSPRRRTFGTAVPGYRSGWFRLKNGERALLFVTQPDRVVYVPTRDGYALLLSVEDPPAFLRALAQATGGL